MNTNSKNLELYTESFQVKTII